MNLPFWTDAGVIDPDAAVPAGQPKVFESVPSAWDIMRIGSPRTIMPGIVEIRNKGRKKRTNRHKAPGVSGQDETVLGYDPCELEIDVIMWHAVQWAKFQKLVPTLQAGKLAPPDPLINGGGGLSVFGITATPPGSPSNQGRDAPVAMYHPELQMLGITLVIVDNICTPRPWKGKPDVRFVLLQCHEYRKPKSGKTQKVKGAITRGVNNAPSLAANNPDATTDPVHTAGAP